jgi:peroxiredoxin
MLNVAAIQVLLLFFAGLAFSINIGDPFPDFIRPNTLDTDECAYLGIDCEKDFALYDVYYDVIIIEFLNVYCHTCRMQVEIFNDLFLTIEKDPKLSEKVCIIGIAVGNSFVEVQDFKKNYGALYPILTDQQKELFNITGNTQGTPHTYILKKEGRHFIVDYHAGGVSSKNRYLTSVTFTLRDKISGTQLGNKAPGYSFTSGGISFDEKSFAAKKVILYFPFKRKYPLAIDTRNTQNQIDILHIISDKFPDISVIIFQYPGFPIQKEKKPSFLYVENNSVKKNRDIFGLTYKPTLFYINEYGRIAFKGEAITFHNAENIIKGKDYRPILDKDEEDIIQLIEEHIRKTGKKIIFTEKIVMGNRKAIYVTTLSPKREGIFLFSRVASRPSLCDICHDSHFIYILDQEGIIQNFIPLQLTKEGNIQWTEDDVQKIEALVFGRSIFDNFPFNPNVDAVSTATMTSSLVFEEFNEGKEIWGELKDYKFRSGYWKQACFKNICTLKHKVEQKKKVNNNLVLDDTLLNTIVTELSLDSCPLHGVYIVLGGNILCSIHGLHNQGCKK